MNDYIKTELKKYNVADAEIAKLKKDYLCLKVKDVDDKETYFLCKEAHQTVKKLRISIEAKRGELLESSREFTKAVNAEAKRLTLGVAEVEDHLLAQRKIVEDEKKRLQDEVERKEREEQDRIKREEEERLEKQRQEQATKEIKLREEQEKLEADRCKIQFEKDALEQDKREQALRVEAEKARFEREKEYQKNLKEAEKLAAERAKKEKEEAVFRAIEDEKRRKKEEALRISEQELREKEEAVRLEALKPDLEKIKDFARRIREIEFPDVNTVFVAHVVDCARNALNIVAQDLEDGI